MPVVLIAHKTNEKSHWEVGILTQGIKERALASTFFARNNKNQLELYVDHTLA